MSTDSSNKSSRRQTGEYRIAIIIQTVVGGLLLYLLPQIIASFLLGAGIGVWGLSETQARDWLDTSAAKFIYFTCTDAILLALLWLFMHQVGETWRTIGVRMPKAAHVLYAIGGYLAYYVILFSLAFVLHLFIPEAFEQRQEIGFDTNSTTNNMILVFIALVVLPPIFEEILFRGFLYTRFKSVLSMRWAAVAISLLFAAAHLQIGSGNALLWVAAFDTFILSLVLVYLREKTGTIWAGSFVHALKNFVAFLLLFKLI